MNIIYFSSSSENTHRFVRKLAFSGAVHAWRIPQDTDTRISVDEPYILISPTYAGGGRAQIGHVDTKGAVPKQVIRFLNDAHNRSLCRAVIGTGNTNFGDSYAIAGAIIATKLGVPLVYQFELSGTPDDVRRVQELIDERVTIDSLTDGR